MIEIMTFSLSKLQLELRKNFKYNEQKAKNTLGKENYLRPNLGN
jgi:hypothetical protein